MWEWKGPALDEGDAAANWLSSILDRRVRCDTRLVSKPNLVRKGGCVCIAAMNASCPSPTLLGNGEFVLLQ